MLLTDYIRMSELLSSGKQERFAKLNALGDEAADSLDWRAREAVDRSQNVIVLTHVPPFREACWHEGAVSNDEFLPHFACRVVGERLGASVRIAPWRCSAATRTVQGSRRSSTIWWCSAEYGAPVIQQILEIA